MREYAVQGDRYNEQSRVLHIEDFLRTNLGDSALNTQRIAAEFHVSPTHLRRLFAKEMHTSPVAYLSSLRLEKAKQLLLSRPELSVAEIARECGYASIYYFSQAFRQAVGKSPSEYRGQAHG